MRRGSGAAAQSLAAPASPETLTRALAKEAGNVAGNNAGGEPVPVPDNDDDDEGDGRDDVGQLKYFVVASRLCKEKLVINTPQGVFQKQQRGRPEKRAREREAERGSRRALD